MSSPTHAPTAPPISEIEVRDLPVGASGWTALSGPPDAEDDPALYRDGAEGQVQDILRATVDLSADSDEAFRHADSWALRYHLSPTRPNVVKPLRLRPGARVLEVGAGCGAVTRYLGEVCERVDALEPTRSRATAAALRTRDLPDVRVFVGMVDELPRRPVYDHIVVVGVLEYVGAGTADPEPYHQFLATLSDLLIPGGTLVVAIENKLGVKYLAGAPEDHSNRVFDSIEGYPGGSPARTFSRRELTAMMAAVGLTPEIRVAFPDYKMTRAVLAPEVLPADASSLLYRVPHFPSPDWMTPREHLFDEALGWRSLVAAGLAGETGNSFLVVAGKGGPSDVWPADLAGEYFSVERRPEYSVRTEMRVRDGAVDLRRRRATDRPATGPISLRTSDARFAPSEDFLDVFVDTADPRSLALLREWTELLAAARGQHPFPVDLVPHNLVIRTDGGVEFIDDEWRDADADADATLRRGVLLLAVQLYHRRPNRAPWAGCRTFRDLAESIGSAVGLSGDWLDMAVQAEATFQEAVISASGEPNPDRVRAGVAGALRSMLDTGLRTPDDFGVRPLAAVQAEVTAAHAEIGRLTGEVIDVHEHLRVTREGLRLTHAELESVRSPTRGHRCRGRAGPPGSGRAGSSGGGAARRAGGGSATPRRRPPHAELAHHGAAAPGPVLTALISGRGRPARPPGSHRLLAAARPTARTADRVTPPRSGPPHRPARPPGSGRRSAGSGGPDCR